MSGVPEDRLADAIARRVVEALREEGCLTSRAFAPSLMTTSQVADFLGVAPSWVYEHAHELGAVRLGEGPKAPLRFDPEKVRATLASCSASRGSKEPGSRSPEPKRPSRRRRSLGTRRDLLPIRGGSVPESGPDADEGEAR